MTLTSKIIRTNIVLRILHCHVLIIYASISREFILNDYPKYSENTSKDVFY